eukprot:symbB.v1.2.029297.t1/scaffold3192.1/size63200/2
MSDVDSPQAKLTRRATNVKAAVLANPNNIRVAVRIRPFNAKELSEGHATETVLEVQDSTVVAYGEFAKEKRYNFDSVFKSIDPTKGASQADVFQELGIPILENALDAYNGCIMAYGQTGQTSSKSYHLQTGKTWMNLLTGETLTNLQTGERCLMRLMLLFQA